MGQGPFIVTKQFKIFIIITFSQFALFYRSGYKTQEEEKYLSGYINLLSLFRIPNLYSELSALRVQKNKCAQNQEPNKAVVR